MSVSKRRQKAILRRQWVEQMRAKWARLVPEREASDKQAAADAVSSS